MTTGGCMGRGHPNLLRSLPKILLQDKPPEATVSQRRAQSPRLSNRKRPQSMTIPQEGKSPRPSHRKRWDHRAHGAHVGPSQTDNSARGCPTDPDTPQPFPVPIPCPSSLHVTIAALVHLVLQEGEGAAPTQPCAQVLQHLSGTGHLPAPGSCSKVTWPDA